MPLSALVVAWVSSGVLRARTVRTWLAGILLVLGALFGGLGLLEDTSLLAVVRVVAIVVAAVALVAYTRSDWYAGLRETRRRVPALGGLVALAFLVGALGGLTAAPDTDEVRVYNRVGL